MKYFSPSLLDGSVTTAKIADDAVTLDKMADFSVSEPQLLNRAVHRAEIDTDTFSLSGSVSVLSTVDLTLGPYSFFPMIHVENQTDLRVTGHSVDGASADNPRFGLKNSSSSFARTYDVDSRRVDV